MTKHTPSKTDIVRAQANRILRSLGFTRTGTALAQLLAPDLQEVKNHEALESWICEQIDGQDLALDHTLSANLDSRILPLIQYLWPERYEQISRHF